MIGLLDYRPGGYSSDGEGFDALAGTGPSASAWIAYIVFVVILVVIVSISAMVAFVALDRPSHTPAHSLTRTSWVDPFAAQDRVVIRDLVVGRR